MRIWLLELRVIFDDVCLAVGELNYDETKNTNNHRDELPIDKGTNKEINLDSIRKRNKSW